MNEMIVKILLELLSTLALATKETKQGKFSESIRVVGEGGICYLTYNEEKLVWELVGEKKVAAMVQRLDRLTQDEARQTISQILKVVHGLLRV